MAHATARNASMHAKPKPQIEMRPNPDGAVELWRAAEQIGVIYPTPEGIRLVLGDADPGGGAILLWTGEPFSMRFDIRGDAL
jgi:hypothetical protein